MDNIAKWVTTENETGEKTLKQHCFIEVQRVTPYTHELYPGNKSLCSKAGIMNESEKFVPMSELQGEEPHPDRCKTCQKVFHLVNRG